jgi:hypothetical protein
MSGIATDKEVVNVPVLIAEEPVKRSWKSHIWSSMSVKGPRGCLLTRRLGRPEGRGEVPHKTRPHPHLVSRARSHDPLP